jgi:enterochelin esterase family protein
MKRIHNLLQELARRPAAECLDEFVARHTFPLLDEDTAIFFFRATEPVDAVYLVHWVFGLESRQAFHRLGSSEAWYLPVDLPHEARVEYKLELHRGERRRWVRDPLNPRQAFDPFGSNSVCPMPGYREPGWAAPEPGVRPGELATFRLPTKVYGGEREVSVYLPQEYKPYKSYPLLICHDGADYLRFAKMNVVLDNLIQRHEVAPLVVVFTTGGARNEEYAANPRQVEFLVDELLPAVRERYAVMPEARHTGLMGASFGGVSSLYTAWERPGVFGKLMLQSGSFVFTDVGHHGRGPLWDPVVDFVNRFRTDPKRIGAKVYLSCGTFESLIYFNRGLVPLLREAGLEVRFREAHDGHNWIAWRDRLREGLAWMYPGHLWMVYD